MILLLYWKPLWGERVTKGTSSDDVSLQRSFHVTLIRAFPRKGYDPEKTPNQVLENILLNVKRFNDDTNGNYYYYQTGEMEIKN